MADDETEKEKEKEKEEKKKRRKLILCIGRDVGYWQSLEQRFQAKYQTLGYEYAQFDIEGDEVSYTDIFFRILEEYPKVVYLDFTSEREAKIRLSQLLYRDNATANIPLIGLARDKEEVRKCLSSGASVVHIKCGEFHDVVYTAAYLFDNKTAVCDKFAKARMKNRKVDLIDDFRVGIITQSTMHLEGNLPMKKDQKVSFDIGIPKNIVPSKNFIVRKVYKENLYYDFTYAYDVDFVIADEPTYDDLENEERTLLEGAETDEEKEKIVDTVKRKKDQRKMEYKNLLAQSRKRLKEWVSQNATYGSLEKNTKILIVDKDLKVLRESERFLDTYPYAIRTQTFLSENFKEIETFRPSIIAFQYMNMIVHDEREKGRDEDEIIEAAMAQIAPMNENIQKCMDKVKSIGHYTPMFVVFNFLDIEEEFGLERNPDFKELIISFDYPLCLTRQETMTAEGLLKIAEIYEKKRKEGREKELKEKIATLKKKDPKRYGRLTLADLDQLRYYISRESPLSYASTSHQARLLTLSESELEIKTEDHLRMSTYRLNFPVEMSVRPVPVKDRDFFEEKGGKVYKCLIHSVGEQDKEELRRQVNEVFCAPAKAKRERELQEFKELNTRMEKEIKEKKEAVQQGAGEVLGEDQEETATGGE